MSLQWRSADHFSSSGEFQHKKKENTHILHVAVKWEISPWLQKYKQIRVIWN